MSRFLPVANPPNRFEKAIREYDLEETPGAPLLVYEDHSRSILSRNDSPDVGFDFSVNPYRGCFHGCAYCVRGDTRVLMADGSERAIADIAVGDAIIGTDLHGGDRRFVATSVLDHWSSPKRVHRIVLANGEDIFASADHRFLTHRGWREVRELDARDHVLTRGSSLPVESVTDLDTEEMMFDITTGTEDFIANGVVSHNCYARPSHEYLSFGAGSDFERKIVVKPNAPELLREAFDKKSWKGDLVMFSGITDCYQPLEHEKKLTRGCLEVCLEYKNPLGIITKSPIIERDIDLLVELVKSTSRCRVSISIPFWNPDYAKAMEPFVTTPARRMKIIETLAKAGVPVGISVSPIVPGLNDEDIGEVLERAKDAGASHAFFVLLRLPGAVKEVFEKSLREKLPLRAEKVFRRLREAHDGKLYDSAFGKRGRGDSVYAKTIDALFTRTAVKLGLKEPGSTSNSYEEMLSGAGPEPPTSFVRPNRSPQTSFGF